VWWKSFPNLRYCSEIYLDRQGVGWNTKVLSKGGPGSSVDIATGYGLDGPGIESL
jgi:hypothetical protein